MRIRPWQWTQIVAAAKSNGFGSGGSCHRLSIDSLHICCLYSVHILHVSGLVAIFGSAEKRGAPEEWQSKTGDFFIQAQWTLALVEVK